MRELLLSEADMVDGGSFAGAVGAGAGGIGAARTVAAIAGVTLGPGAAAAVIVGGFVGGVALYYLTD